MAYNVLSLANSVLELVPCYIFWKDKNSVFLGCNQLFAKLAMLKTSADIVGKTDYDMPWSKEESDRYRADDQLVIETGHPIMNIEETQTFPDGRKITIITNKVPYRNEAGEIIGVIGVYHDISEIKNAQNELVAAKEKAEAANQAKTEFVQNMQHDIRTPSAGLWGVLDILAKAEPEGTKKETLEMAVAASRRLLDLCNDAVEFGDLGGNTRPQLEKPFDIRALARSIIELNLPAAFVKDLGIHFHIDSTVPAHIVSDEFRISRMLINLLGNAIKFSHKGEVTLNIKAATNEENPRKGVLTIEVKDQGIGIAPDKINHIFEKFSRGVASNTNKYPGTGLGLYVVKTFIDELDGDIWVESHQNEGAYFKLILPFKVLWEEIKKPGKKIDEHFSSPLKKTEKEVTLKEETMSSEKTPFSHELLIIEDDKTCLFAEKNVLSDYTSKIDSAENVADALKKLSAKRYDLVISDLGLPDGSGNDIVATIKAGPESPNHHTPFVAMTAHQDAAKHKQAMDAGFEAVGTKPLSAEKAIEFLRTYPALDEETDYEEEGLAVIDLPLGIQRIGSHKEENAIEALSLLYESFQEDIPNLREAQKNNDIAVVRDVLHKIRGGLYYTGTPRLEEAFKLLHAEVKRTRDLIEIKDMFSLVYHEVNLFNEQFKELMNKK